MGEQKSNGRTSHVSRPSGFACQLPYKVVRSPRRPPPAVNITSASGPGAPPHPSPQTPNRRSGFIIRVAELSRVKAQERQRGPVAPAPFSAVGGPARAPKAQITCHIMRGLAQQAPLLFLSLSLTRTHTDRRARRMRHYC